MKTWVLQIWTHDLTCQHGENQIPSIRWQIVQLPIIERGLGLTNLRNRNDGLLVKWIWRYQFKKDALWKHIIYAKYGSPCSHIATDSLKTQRGHGHTYLRCIISSMIILFTWLIRVTILYFRRTLGWDPSFLRMLSLDYLLYLTIKRLLLHFVGTLIMKPPWDRDWWMDFDVLIAYAPCSLHDGWYLWRELNPGGSVWSRSLIYWKN